MPLPLDLDDNVLFANHDTVCKAVLALDPGGWNTDGSHYPVTSLRARFMIALIRDELIELALGSRTDLSPDILL